MFSWVRTGAFTRRPRFQSASSCPSMGGACLFVKSAPATGQLATNSEKARASVPSWAVRSELSAVAVGTGIAPRPPHRSVRAALPHTAPALSHDAKRSLG